MERLKIDDCWSEEEIPIHRGLLTIAYQLRGRREPQWNKNTVSAWGEEQRAKSKGQ